MTLELINPEGLSSPLSYTHVVAATGSRLVFVAGQVAVIVWFPSALMATSSLYFVPPVRTSGRTLRRSPAPILIASVDRGVCS